MRLYLVRHGKAEYGQEDADRALSPRGREDSKAVAIHLEKQRLGIHRVVHSNLLRAAETAQILARRLAPSVDPGAIEGIEPWGDVEAFAEVVESWDEDTMVCGHEPFMGQALSYLLTGNHSAGLLDVKTATVMCLDRNSGGDAGGDVWQLRWVITPRIIRGPKRGDN